MKKGTRATTVAQSSKSTLKAINDIYIVLEDPVETAYDTGVSADVTEAIKSGKLIIPEKWQDFSQKYPCKGIVISRGDKCKYPIEVGDRIIYARLGVQRYQIDGKTLCDVRESDIHGTIESS